MTLTLLPEVTGGRFNPEAYLGFLRSKLHFGQDTGRIVDRAAINPMLKPHQVDLVLWAARKGRAALFAAFGLGKSFMQLELCRLLLPFAGPGAMALIVLPLGVRPEFMADAAKLGIAVRFVRRDSEIDGPGIYLTNYESVRDGRLDPARFAVATLDEASVLRSFGSKTYQEFLRLFASVRWRFVATATPSPNSYKELIHYAGFLGVMDTGQALTRFFQRDSTSAGNLTLYPHMVREFHLWLHSWAAFVQRPSDLGHDDSGYDLPPLVLRVHEVDAGAGDVGADRDGQERMFRDAALGLKDAAAEKRASMPARVAKMLEIVRASPDDHMILWHDLEDERRAIKAALPAACEVYGTLDLDERERRVIAFADGQEKYLATKPEISGSGCNFQRHCHRAVFLGITYSFNDFIQAIHRIRRYLQPWACEIDVIISKAEREVWRSVERKWAEHEELTGRMSALIREHGLSTLGLEAELARTIGVERQQVVGERYLVAHNDCVLEVASMADDSVDMVLTSIPFGNHYEYSTCLEDFGHNTDNRRFFEQMDHLTPGLLRVLRPGRIAAIHVKDRVLFKDVTGVGSSSIDPFHADCIAHYRRHGFIYCGMIIVVTDVVRENAGTYRLGWTEQCKDGTTKGVGSPEYVLLLRKPQTDLATAYADVPVVKDKLRYTRARWQVDAHAFWRSRGDRFLTAEEFAGMGPDLLASAFPAITAQRIYDHETHVTVAEALEQAGRLPSGFGCVLPGSHHPEVWDDVVRMHTLNSAQAQRNQVQHICPLQFDIVDRLIRRFTNVGEEVFDPFGGLFTVPYAR